MNADGCAIPLLRDADHDQLLFRQLLDGETGSLTYLLGDGSSGEAVLVDPVFEQHERDWALIRELGLTLVCSLDTHIHADHVTGSWLMHERSGCDIALAANAQGEFVTRALNHADQVRFGGRWLDVRATPGHTASCLSYVLDDQSLACTGDTLLIRGCGRCDFQQGDPAQLWHSVHQQLFSLPDSCLLYPAHDYTGRLVSTVAEERLFNQRLGGGASERDFIGTMQNLQLPHPRRMDAALPGNLRSGRPEGTNQEEPWAPICRSYAGLPELTPEWVVHNSDALSLLDVRSKEEYEGPDGRIQGSLLIPLPELPGRIASLSKQRPVVVICHSGCRSALATKQLLAHGITRAANLRGGLKRWGDEGYPLIVGPQPGASNPAGAENRTKTT